MSTSEVSNGGLAAYEELPGEGDTLHGGPCMSQIPPVRSLLPQALMILLQVIRTIEFMQATYLQGKKNIDLP